MTRKTGKVALKARQQMRAAKLAQQKRELERAGISMKLDKPSAKVLKEKDEELKKLYMELFPEAQTSSEEGGEGESTEKAEEKPSEETSEEPQQKETSGE
ncbi:MAG: hypothetical protein ACK4GQ_00415 [Candidatus Hadarchaeales archaeon]